MREGCIRIVLVKKQKIRQKEKLPFIYGIVPLARATEKKQQREV